MGTALILSKAVDWPLAMLSELTVDSDLRLRKLAAGACVAVLVAMARDAMVSVLKETSCNAIVSLVFIPEKSGKTRRVSS